MKFSLRFCTTALIAALLLVVGLQFSVLREPAQDRPIGSGEPRPGLASASATFNLAAVDSSSAQVQNNLAAVDSAPLPDTLKYVIAGGYVLMFIGMVIEGPMVTAAGAFAAALGYLNIFAVFALSISADLSADFAYYLIGYFSRVAVIEKYGHRFGLTTARMKRMEHLLKTHPKKTILALKLIPGLALPGLMMVGATRLRITTFALICLAIILPIEGGFMYLGYHFGRSYDAISQYVHNGSYFIIFSIVVLLVVYFAYKKLTAMFAKRLETI